MKEVFRPDRAAASPSGEIRSRPDKVFANQEALLRDARRECDCQIRVERELAWERRERREVQACHLRRALITAGCIFVLPAIIWLARPAPLACTWETGGFALVVLWASWMITE